MNLQEYQNTKLKCLERNYRLARQMLAELEAEVKKLKNSHWACHKIIDTLLYERNEARYWARRYKRVYIASILLTGNVIEQTRNGRYRIAKKNRKA